MWLLKSAFWIGLALLVDRMSPAKKAKVDVQRIKAAAKAHIKRKFAS